MEFILLPVVSLLAEEILTAILCFQVGSTTMRRCRALYDCSADNEDELSFHEGEIIVVINERTEDDNWMEGQVEGTSRRGMFPVSFVHMLPD